MATILLSISKVRENTLKNIFTVKTQQLPFFKFFFHVKHGVIDNATP